VGVCGQKLCCSRFLDQIDAVSMNMAKNQNLALNPSKINGCCGRLLCCLSYEDEQYYESSKTMPNIGSRIKTPLGDGQVISVDVLNRKYKAIVNGEKEEFTVDEK
ncbi:MAG: regulatory iron-sulfur-containing complex subunit RicT, partial [Bacilli bacterium]